MQNDVHSLQTQLANLTAVVEIADSTKMAEIDDLKQRHQQELDSIRLLTDGEKEKAQSMFHHFPFHLETIGVRVADIRAKYDNDLTNLRRKIELLQQENYELKSRVADDK